MKKLMTISLMTLTMLTISVKAQNQEKAAVIGVTTENVNIDPTEAESLFRIELMKTEYYLCGRRKDEVLE